MYSRCIDENVIYSKGPDPPLTPCQKAHNMSLVGIKTLKVGMQHSDLVSMLLIVLLSQNCHFKTLKRLHIIYLKRSFQLGYTVEGCIIHLPHTRSNGRARGYSIAVCRYDNIIYNLNTVTIIHNTTQCTAQINTDYNTLSSRQ